MKKVLIAALVCGSAVSLSACGGASGLKFNLAYDNMSRTMTYNFTSPLQLPDGTTIVAGNLKPVWRDLSSTLDVAFNDVTNQGQSAADMISVEAATDFKNANIFGGNAIAEELMNYGQQGKFVDLSEYLDDELSNFNTYLNANPDIKDSITTYSGGIYHIPYVSEIGETARTYNMRTDWVEMLLDGGTTGNKMPTGFDTTSYAMKSYSAYYGADNPGGTRPLTSYPQGSSYTGVSKKNSDNIIDIMNSLSTQNGSTLAAALIDYINDQYNYSSPSQLYVGARAAYDMDELVALMRVVKANESALSSATSVTGQSATVHPFFVRQSSYREDILRFATYFDGGRVFGSDSYNSKWVFDENGQIQYTYNTKEVYDVLTYLSAMFDEGLIHTESLDTTNSANFRTQLYGSDDTPGAEFGFMSYDWIASSTADSLGDNINVVLPPVANVNGSWQYYIDNSRTIKPDGWSISVAGSSDTQIKEALKVFDYMFTEEGSKLQNYGMDCLLSDETGTYDDNTTYPLFNTWTTNTCDDLAEGDLSVFLRDYIGALMPIGFAKEIGFEYQYTSVRGWAGINMLNASSVNYPSYEGTGTVVTGANAYYYKLVPAVFSMTSMQQSNAKLYTPQEEFYELLFNVIRYDSAGTGSNSTVSIPANYAAYEQLFKDINIAGYIQTYQQAYTNMLSSRN